MTTRHEYVEELLAEWEELSPIRAIVHNILDEAIPKAVKRRLLKPLLPRLVSPVRKRKLEKRKAVLEEFDPLFNPKSEMFVNKYRDLLSLIATDDLKSTPKIIKLKEADILKDYSTIFPIGHRLADDTLIFLDAMTPGVTEVTGNKMKGKEV